MMEACSLMSRPAVLVLSLPLAAMEAAEALSPPRHCCAAKT